MLATIGDDALVPPTICQCRNLGVRNVSYTSTPVLGSATAATSAMARLEHDASVCQAGLAMKALHPLPEPLQAVSVQPRAAAERLSVVPPTAITPAKAAGCSGPKPLSP